MTGTTAAPLVTVVMPVYNLEAFVADSVASVTGQTLRDIELICVDDGSTDSSGAILDDLATRDQRIVIVRQANAGVSAARNAGLRVARGEYVKFLDGDDELVPDALERAYRYASENSLDLVTFDAEPVFETPQLAEQFSSYRTYYTHAHPYPDGLTGPQMLAALTANNEYRPSTLVQMYRTRLLTHNGIEFPEGVLHEDNPFSLKAILVAQRAGHLPAVCARRRFRAHSTMTTPNDVRHYLGCLTGVALMTRFVERMDLEPQAAEAAYVQIAAVYRRAARILQELPRDVRDATHAQPGTPESLAEKFLWIQLHEVRTRDLKIRDDAKAIARLQATVDRYKEADGRFLRRLDAKIAARTRKDTEG